MSQIVQWGSTPPSTTPTAEADTSGEVAATAVPALHEILAVVETDSAEFLVGDLFRRRFGAPSAPDFPRHFVAFYKPAPGTLVPVGYVHQSVWEGCHLCGGLVIDERLYRRMDPGHRRVVREAGGIAELLLKESFARVLPESIAVWGYVGDKQAEQVDLRVGFRHTRHPHVMVIWNRDLTPAEQEAWIDRVIALGPF